MIQQNSIQTSLFGLESMAKEVELTYKSFNNLNKERIAKLREYKLDDYIYDIENIGIKKTWDDICDYVILYNDNTDFLNINNFGEMYEIALALTNKELKKESGQYYTPDDVASLMSKWFNNIKGYNICDVACGTGQLILTYLDLIGKNKAIKIISEGRLYLFDSDKVALKICKTSLLLKYGIEFNDKIHDIHGDFLDININLPENSKVISNPPYAKITNINPNWEKTKIQCDTKELYSSFMEKIFNQAEATVIITPFSFISGNKFKSLRYQMCNLGNGFIVSFDNVPGNIFCGRKHGIFNTNTANSVRAAITVLNKNPEKKGFRVSPLIRFKNSERQNILVPEILESILPDDYQIVDKNNTAFKKIDKTLFGIYNNWIKKSDKKIKDIISKNTSNHMIDMPNTCRYFTTASYRKLHRSGSITLNIEDNDIFNFVYCFINSSFTYWWWRIFDGGITYPLGLLYELPIPINLLTNEDKEFFADMCKKMQNEESKYVVKKINAGIAQENIKFPTNYRNEINNRILCILGNNNDSEEIFKNVHANTFL